MFLLFTEVTVVFLGFTLDESSIISGLIGSILGIIGSVIVAIIYVRNQNKLEKNKRISEQIQKMYIEQGLLPLQEAVQEYATSSIFALLDYKKYFINLYMKQNNEKKFLDMVNDIKKRPGVKSMIDRQFDSAIDTFPHVRRFGNVVYGVIIRILQNWSDLVRDMMNWENMKPQFSKSDIDEAQRSMDGVVTLIQESQLYILNRLDNLKDYILENDYYSYMDFLKILNTERYKNFIDDLDNYNKLYTKVMDAFTNPDRTKMKEVSLEFNEYNKKIRENPFKDESSKK